MSQVCCQSAVSRSVNAVNCKMEHLDISILKTGVQLFLLADYYICRSAYSAVVVPLERYTLIFAYISAYSALVVLLEKCCKLKAL